MKGKFMKILKIGIPVLTLVLIASQLMNACAVSPNELLEMYERQQAIEIEVAYPESQEQGTEKEVNWTELAFLNTYPEFREAFDDTLGITLQGTNGKNGVVYADLSGNHTNNSTLRYAFANAKFHNVFWNNTQAIEKLTEAAENTYSDISTAKYAIINAYFNIFPDAEPNYFNGNQTLTRSEFLAGVFRAETPVSDLQSDYNFESAVDPAGTDQNTIFASQLQDYSYLTLEDQSLNSGTAQGTITRAEAVYTLVKKYFPNEFNAVIGSESSYSDAKNGGDIALKAGFRDKETGAVKDYWKSYELSYAIQNADKGLPTDLYKALVVAKNKGLIVGSESRWDDGLTKSEAISLITKVYESLGTYISADRGASTGQVVDNTNPTPTTNPSEQTPSEQTPTEDIYTITEKDYYEDESGIIHYTDELVDFVKSFSNYSKYDDGQIKAIIESEHFFGIMTAGRLYEDIHGELEAELKDPLTLAVLKKTVPAIAVEETTPSDPAGNSGYGDISKVEDSNLGGSDENEVTPEDEQQPTDMSDKVDETTGELKPSPTPIPTGTPSGTGSTEEAPEIIVSTPEDQTPQFTYESLYKTMYATQAVNTRKGPSTDFEKTGNLKKGQQVTVIGQCNETGWFMVQDGADVYFVTDKYLTETPPATPTPAPTATPKPEAKPTETPAPTEAPKQDTGNTSETTTPKDGTTATQTITYTYKGVDENNNEITYEEEMTAQGTYTTSILDDKTYFVVLGLEDKEGFGVPIEGEGALYAWRKIYPNSEYTFIDGQMTIFPAGYETKKGTWDDSYELNAH